MMVCSCVEQDACVLILCRYQAGCLSWVLSMAEVLHTTCKKFPGRSLELEGLSTIKYLKLYAAAAVAAAAHPPPLSTTTTAPSNCASLVMSP